MDGLMVLVFQLVLLAATAVLTVLAASSARRAASFDVTRDFDALVAVVAKLQSAARSEKMTRVRAAATEAQPPQPVDLATSKLSHEQLRALARARRNGVTQ